MLPRSSKPFAVVRPHQEVAPVLEGCPHREHVVDLRHSPLSILPMAPPRSLNWSRRLSAVSSHALLRTLALSLPVSSPNASLRTSWSVATSRTRPAVAAEAVDKLVHHGEVLVRNRLFHELDVAVGSAVVRCQQGFSGKAGTIDTKALEVGRDLLLGAKLKHVCRRFNAASMLEGSCAASEAEASSPYMPSKPSYRSFIRPACSSVILP
jgi:hypothetical protein